MKYEKLAEGILALLNGLDYDFRMYKGVDGKRTSNPYEARYLYVKEPNIMFIIDEPSNTLTVHKANMSFVDFKAIHQSIRSLARRYFVNLETRDYNKAFSPRDFSPVQLKKDYMADTINESHQREISETYQRGNKHLQIRETSDSIELMTNGEHLICLPYPVDDLMPVLIEKALSDELTKPFIRRLFSVYEQYQTLCKKESYGSLTLNESKMLSELKQLL